MIIISPRHETDRSIKTHPLAQGYNFNKDIHM